MTSGLPASPALTATAAISHGEEVARDPKAPSILPLALQQTATRHAEHGILHLPSDGTLRFERYAELLTTATRVLAGLRAAGKGPGSKVILQLDQNHEFLHVFWGCILGGIVPIPIAVAPSYRERNAIVTKLLGAWEMLEQPLVVAGERITAEVRVAGRLAPTDAFEVVSIDQLYEARGSVERHVPAPDDLALLLLTSGSTGRPKAVRHTHRSLLTWAAADIQMNGFSPADVSLNWLPLDHVGGLVMFHLRDLIGGCQQIHSATDIVLRDPLTWLALIERYRATITWAPNFAYGLVNDRAEQISRGRWDLSSMRFILNAGEAIVPRTARRFIQVLAPHGLRPDAMHPAWGMSETSSAVVYSSRFSLESTRDDDTFVELGLPSPGFSMRIVDAAGGIAAEGTPGQLEVRGPSVTPGYLGDPALNQAAFSPDGWFRAGDLGIIRDGRLTITGRDKDIIIINGANYHCHEIEAVVEELDGVATSYTAACPVRTATSETDQLAVFFHPETSDDEQLATLLRDIRRNIVTRLGIAPTYILPVEKREIPKTEIGKIQRSLLRRRLESGEFAAILETRRERGAIVAEPRDTLESLIVSAWQELLKISQVGIDEDFFELGGDSLIAVHLMYRLSDQLQVDLKAPVLFMAPTVAELAARIREEQSRDVARERLFRKVEQMTDEELEAFLEQEGLKTPAQTHSPEAL